MAKIASFAMVFRKSPSTKTIPFITTNCMALTLYHSTFLLDDPPIITIHTIHFKETTVKTKAKQLPRWKLQFFFLDSDHTEGPTL